MLTSRALLVPHLPTLLVDETRGDITEMIEAIQAQARHLREEKPDAVVALSARWTSAGPFFADGGKRHRSLIDEPGYGVEPRYDCTGFPELARALVDIAIQGGVRAGLAQHGVDSGVAVPMHFLAPEKLWPVVPVSISEASREEHRAWGAALRRAMAARPERIAFVVGGALSLNQHAFNLRRDVPEAVEFDRRVLESIEHGAWDELPLHEARLAERAQPEAGLKHLEVLRGFLLSDAPGRVRCHESSPGVGAALIEFELRAAVEA